MFDIFVSSPSFNSKIPEILEMIKKYDIKVFFNEKDVKLSMDTFLIQALNCKVLIAGTEDLKELCELSNNLLGISRLGVGLDNVPIETCQQKGIKILNTPDAQATSVAQFTLGLIIDCIRNISISSFEFQNAIWSRREGYDFSEITVGIIGFGKIGWQVSQYLSFLDFKKILVFDPYISDEKITKARRELRKIEFVDKHFLAINSDIVTLHCNLTNDSKKIVNRQFMDSMQLNSSLINTARSGLIDLPYLYSLLDVKFNRIALDVHEIEPYTQENFIHSKIIGTPHISSMSRKTRDLMCLESFENALDILLGSDKWRGAEI